MTALPLLTPLLSLYLSPDPRFKSSLSLISMSGVTAEKALDGGWGWVIVVSAFMAQFLAFGSPQSVGVLYPEWLSTYQEGKGMTAWVGSMVSGVALLTSE